jgi:hypothetical protein
MKRFGLGLADVRDGDGADLVLAQHGGRGLSLSLALLVMVEFFGVTAWARNAGSILASCACNRRN